jgi:autoinducer 2-degrading protein
MFVLLVQFTVKPGTEDQAKGYMRKMEENTRREPGCQLYIGSQSNTEPRRFCFYEQYVDEKALQAHRAAPYFAEFVTNGLAALMESRTSETFTTISS